MAIITIPTKRLKLSDIPEPSADWATIGRFALTFDSREAGPYLKRPPDPRELSVSSSLVDLRHYIYFQQRRWNHFGRHPDPVTVQGVREVMWMIRTKLEAQPGPSAPNE
jgi:hypothetical protein